MTQEWKQVRRREIGTERRRSNGEDEGAKVVLGRLEDPDRVYFERLLQASRGLEHPALVTIRDGGFEDGQAYLLEASHEGRLLREVLREGPLDPPRALQVALDLLNGLTYCHHKGHVHGGLSPGNVLVVEREGALRGTMLAFGFATALGPKQDALFGPLRVDSDYAAPEVLKGEPVDPRTDVYSVGVLLYLMLTGRHPIHAPSAESAVMRRLKENAALLPSGIIDDQNTALEDAVRSALGHALAKDPSRRFASARAFALALRPGGAPPDGDDPEAWPEAAPGDCAGIGCAKVIPASSERFWSMRHSDGPFRCVACGKSYCGAEHWDTRSLTCRGCRDAQPEPALGGPPPEPLPLVLALEGTAPAAQATEGDAKQDSGGEGRDDRRQTRREALRALLTRESAMNWLNVQPQRGRTSRQEPARRPSERLAKASEEERGPEPEQPEAATQADASQKENDAEAAVTNEAETAHEAGAGKTKAADEAKQDKQAKQAKQDKQDKQAKKDKQAKQDEQDEAVERAMIDAWADAKEQTEQATTRMRKVGTRGVKRPEPKADTAPEPSPTKESPPEEPVAARPSFRVPKEAARSGDAAKWLFVVSALLLVIVVGGLQWQGERGSLERTQADVKGLEKRLEDAHQRAERFALLEAQLSDQEQALKARTADLRKQLAATAEELRLAKESVQSEGQLRIDLGKQLKESQAAHEQLAKRAKVLEAAVTKGVKAHQAYEARLQVLHGEVAALQAKLKAERLLGVQAAEAAQLLSTKLTKTKARLSGLASDHKDLQARIKELETDKRDLDQKGVALEARLRKALLENARLQQSMAGAARVALRFRQLDAAGGTVVTTQPKLTPGPAGRVLLLVELAAARRLLLPAEQGKALLAIHLHLSQPPAYALSLAGQRLTPAQTDAVPAKGTPHLAAPPAGDTIVRFWVDAAAAKGFLSGAKQGEGLGFVLAGQGQGNSVQILKAELVASPLSGDAGLRLKELRLRLREKKKLKQY